MQNFTSEIRDALRLVLVNGIGPRIRRNLINYFGSAGKVFEADPFQLRQVPEVGGKIISAILDTPASLVDEQLELCQKHDIHIITDSDPDYPKLMKTMPDAPGLIFIQGTITPRDSVSLAVIGTRHASFYGERQAERLTGEFVRAGFSIVSGLARGIDGISHKAALDFGGRTIAVLGHGLGLPPYPREHRSLADRILESGGALLSEYPPLRPATAGTFPQRNRLIAGMTLGTVVIEAGAHSGTMLTAQFALDYGREVFALPGPVDSRVSTGCHRLIRSGACLIESVEDVLQELGPIHERFPVHETESVAEMVERPAEIALTDQERKVFETIPKDGATVDQLTQSTAIPVWKIMTVLTGLEIKRLIKRGAGQRIYRI